MKKSLSVVLLAAIVGSVSACASVRHTIATPAALEQLQWKTAWLYLVTHYDPVDRVFDVGARPGDERDALAGTCDATPGVRCAGTRGVRRAWPNAVRGYAVTGTRNQRSDARVPGDHDALTEEPAGRQRG